VAEVGQTCVGCAVSEGGGGCRYDTFHPSACSKPFLPKYCSTDFHTSSAGSTPLKGLHNQPPPHPLFLKGYHCTQPRSGAPRAISFPVVSQVHRLGVAKRRWTLHVICRSLAGPGAGGTKVGCAPGWKYPPYPRPHPFPNRGGTGWRREVEIPSDTQCTVIACLCLPPYLPC